MNQLTPPPQLYKNILEEINAKKKLAEIKRAIFLWIFTFTASWFSFVFFLNNFSRQAGETGFGNLFSLVLTDFSVVKSNFLDYVLSLAESLPAVSVAFLGLAALFIIGSTVKLLTSSVELKRIKQV